MFWHTETKSLLIVYVDDFKLAAREMEHDALWLAIRRLIGMDPEALDGRSLGCSHERFTTTAEQMQDLLDSHPLYHPRPSQGGKPQSAGAGSASQEEAYTC